MKLTPLRYIRNNANVISPPLNYSHSATAEPLESTWASVGSTILVPLQEDLRDWSIRVNFRTKKRTI